MKYPLDNQAIEEMSRDLLLHHRGQNQTVGDLVKLLEEAMASCEDEDEEWFSDAERFLKGLSTRRMDFETHRFNQKNGYAKTSKSPYPATASESVGPIDLAKENELNAMEKDFGDEMSEEDIARMFNEKPKKKKKTKPIEKMTLKEIEDLEEAQNNSNDIYKVSARIKNLARTAVKGNLTAQGDMVTNTFAHLIKGIYDFAQTVQDKDTKTKLIQYAKDQEQAPANLIAALGAGVKLK